MHIYSLSCTDVTFLSVIYMRKCCIRSVVRNNTKGQTNIPRKLVMSTNTLMKSHLTIKKSMIL